VQRRMTPKTKARWLVIPFLLGCFFFLCFWCCLPGFCTLSPARFPLCFLFSFFEIVFGKKAFGLCFRIPLLWKNTMMVRVLEPGFGWTQAFSGSVSSPSFSSVFFFTDFGFLFFCRDEDNSKANSCLYVAPPFSLLLSVNLCFFSVFALFFLCFLGFSSLFLFSSLPPVFSFWFYDSFSPFSPLGPALFSLVALRSLGFIAENNVVSSIDCRCNGGGGRLNR